MIDAKSLIEFFEKEYSVQFVDMETQRKALDIIAERENATKKCCATCKWIKHGDGEYLHEEDTVCVNHQSAHVTEWVFENDVCDYWEKAEKLRSV